MTSLTILVSCLTITVISAGSFGYGADNGPERWDGICSSGIRQSPIDIRPSSVDYAALSRLHFRHYDHMGKIDVANNGHTVVAQGFPEWNEHQPYITGGGLKHTYKLVQFHLHWSHNDHSGSEHKIGGLSYPAELHLVHVRSDLTMQEALRTVDGLAVVGVFLSLAHDSEPMSYIADGISQVATYQTNHTVDEFKLRSLLPANHEAFYRYEGSLTTPTCNEAVVWSVLAEPISVTAKQLKALRQIQNINGIPHSHNYRPVQPLNGRRVLYRPSQIDRSFILSVLDPTQSSSLVTVFSTIISVIMINLL